MVGGDEDDGNEEEAEAETLSVGTSVTAIVGGDIDGSTDEADSLDDDEEEADDATGVGDGVARSSITDNGRGGSWSTITSGVGVCAADLGMVRATCSSYCRRSSGVIHTSSS